MRPLYLRVKWSFTSAKMRKLVGLYITTINKK